MFSLIALFLAARKQPAVVAAPQPRRAPANDAQVAKDRSLAA